jgi:hypothetical protein
MRAGEWPCPFSGQPGDHLHHMTGRAANGKYLDPELVGPLVAGQHRLEHQSWDPSFSDGVDGESDVLRLRRIAHHLVRLGEHKEGGVVLLPAFVVRQIGVTLHRIADRLEGRP